jgi:YVTN family beta-propeller protein
MKKQSAYLQANGSGKSNGRYRSLSRWTVRLGLVSLFLVAAALCTVVKPSVSPRINSKSLVGKQSDSSWLEVTQQVIRPWSQQYFIKGRPVDMAFNSKRSKLAILNVAGIELMDEDTGAVQQIKTRTTSYCGIAFRPGDKEIWASEAAPNGDGSLYIGTLSATGFPVGEERVKLPGQAFPTGIAFAPDGAKAYVALNSRNTVAVIDANTKVIEREIKVGLAPLFVKLSLDGGELFVSNRGGDVPASGASEGFSSNTAMATDPITGAVLGGTVSVVRLKDFNSREVAVGRAPTSLALSPDGTTLAVANSHSDSVTVIDTATLKTSTISIPTIPDGLLGTAPVSVVFSSDGKQLYVAAALNNAVVVLNKSGTTYVQAGAIPTGWFPAALAFDRNQQLVVLNIKGAGNTDNGKGGHETHSFEGSVMRLPLLTQSQLQTATHMVTIANNPKFEAAGGVANLESLGIRHVFLFVKENRTYDQVFGDMAQANSDPKFLMFGRDVTPNHHALAEKYVLLDNFYATGAISFDGHQWLEQGFVSDNVERALNSHPRGYAWNLSDALDVSPAGFIWQHARRPLDVRIGGVLSLPSKRDPRTQTAIDINEDELRAWTDYWRLYQEGKWMGAVGSRAAVPALANIMDSRYPVNSMRVPDQIRASVLEQELAVAEKTGRLPDLMVYGLTSDHTMGTSPGNPTPSAMVADNDLALGRIVEGISKSSFWSSSLILVVEDDAQNGVDHVDGHRTVALAIGPSVKRGVVDSNFYTQLSMARTMQDILHIEPQTHFLKAARAMNSIFTPNKNLEAYTAIKPKIALDTMNPPLNALSGKPLYAARRSAAMNWNHVDDVPTQLLNQILWWDNRGYDKVMPPSRSTPQN